MVLDFLVDAFHMLYLQDHNAWLPVAQAIARGLPGLAGTATAQYIYYGAWWAHVTIALAYLAYIPWFSKHTHIVAAQATILPKGVKS